MKNPKEEDPEVKFKKEYKKLYEEIIRSSILEERYKTILLLGLLSILVLSVYGLFKLFS